jgi:hypothetical protein
MHTERNACRFDARLGKRAGPVVSELADPHRKGDELRRNRRRIRNDRCRVSDIKPVEVRGAEQDQVNQQTQHNLEGEDRDQGPTGVKQIPNLMHV